MFIEVEKGLFVNSDHVIAVDTLTRNVSLDVCNTDGIPRHIRGDSDNKIWKTFVREICSNAGSRD